MDKQIESISFSISLTRACLYQDHDDEHGGIITLIQAGMAIHQNYAGRTFYSWFNVRKPQPQLLVNGEQGFLSGNIHLHIDLSPIQTTHGSKNCCPPTHAVYEFMLVVYIWCDGDILYINLAFILMVASKLTASWIQH